MNRPQPTAPHTRKLLIWTVMPTHHQSAFFAALRDSGVDLVVHYYERVSDERRRLGWAEFAELPDGERYVSASITALGACPDWRKRIHILPGYSRWFLPAIAMLLSVAGIPWLHWSERSRPSTRSALGEAVRRAYGALVNRCALGALAIGDMAHRDFLRWGIAERKIRYLPYSIAGLRAPARPRPAGAGPAFLFAGLMCHGKGTDVLLRAFATAHRQHPAATLDIVGDDESGGEYARLATALGLGTAVRFQGPRPAAAMAETIAACDVFVLPSREDGWGVVLNEAASLGKAIIATENCGATHHLICDGKNGFRVPAEDARALAERMLRYCHNPMLAAEHGACSAQIFPELSPARNAARLQTAIAQFLQETARGGWSLSGLR